MIYFCSVEGNEAEFCVTLKFVSSVREAVLHLLFYKAPEVSQDSGVCQLRTATTNASIYSVFARGNCARWLQKKIDVKFSLIFICFVWG